MMQVGVLQSLQIGTPKRYGVVGAANPIERAFETSFVRVPTTQPRWLFTTHLEGSEQADKKNHGQLSQAVLLYAAAHYPIWQEELQQPEIGPGGFGENLTIEGLSEETACIGDIYAIDDARIRVTGPRYPCWKIERRWERAGLTARVAETGRTGWYCCVMHEGLIETGLPIMLVDRPYPQWNIALINDFAHNRNHDVKVAQAIADCPLLDGFWPELIMHNIAKHTRKAS